MFVWPGRFAEPCAVFVVEQRSQLVVHPAVVTVEPFDFLRVEQGPVYRFHVDGTEGEWVELEECAELGFPIGQDDLRVFDAYAMPPFFVDARFVGHGHVGEEWGRHIVHADLMRTFVHAQAGTHTMSCAVKIIDAFLPHGIAGASVELRAAATLRELGTGQPDVSFQD